jgi:hypothetical protein
VQSRHCVDVGHENERLSKDSQKLNKDSVGTRVNSSRKEIETLLEEPLEMGDSEQFSSKSGHSPKNFNQLELLFVSELSLQKLP